MYLTLRCCRLHGAVAGHVDATWLNVCRVVGLVGPGSQGSGPVIRLRLGHMDRWSGGGLLTFWARCGSALPGIVRALCTRLLQLGGAAEVNVKGGVGSGLGPDISRERAAGEWWLSECR